ncbi:MAG: alpha/beta hydrolase [Bacteroidetes bacterium]|nr:MAG: alpha/beta hydrolase [Bacteroidota bacterium]
MKLYCISGLGIDQTPFEFLDIHSDYELVYIKWIEAKKKESLPEYALRLAEVIDDSEPFALLGLSFGGMIAIEIAKVKKPRHLILLSSISGPGQMPGLYKLGKAIKVYSWFPFELVKRNVKLTNKLFGIKGQAHQRIMNNVFEKTDPEFLRWAVRAILTWKNNEEVPHKSIRGTRDKILPLLNAQPDYVIEDGSHFMVVVKADHISKIINEILD